MWWKILAITGAIVLFFLCLAYGSLIYERRILPKVSKNKILKDLPFTFLALSYLILWTVFSLLIILPITLFLAEKIGSFFGIPA